MIDSVTSTSLTVPRGTPGLVGMSLDMTLVYEAERRLSDLRSVNHETAPELMAYFNNALNNITKYTAWVEYEILNAEKYYGIAKAEVVLDKAPEVFKNKYKDSGIKFNEDFREAMVAKDPDCQARLDTLNYLKAIRSFLENKGSAFAKAHYTAKSALEHRKGINPVPNLSGVVGELSHGVDGDGFMGLSKHSK